MNRQTNLYFISDDSFFLHGIKENAEWNFSRPSYFINTNEGIPHFNPTHGDLIVLSVSDIHMRRSFMKMSVVRRCRIIMLLTEPMIKASRGTWPWLIRKSIGFGELAGTLYKAGKLRRYQEDAPLITREIFHLLGRGVHVEELAERLQLSAKYVYQVKRRHIRNCGLYSCNSASVLICRDILSTTHDGG